MSGDNNLGRLVPAGMAANDVVMRRAERSGIGVLQPSLGLDALAAMAGIMQPFTASSLVAAVPFNWAVFLKVGFWVLPGKSGVL